MLSLATNQTMDRLAQPGRYFFAIPSAVCGVQCFLNGRYSGGLSPSLPWAPGPFIALAMAGASSLLPLFPART